MGFIIFGVKSLGWKV